MAWSAEIKNARIYFNEYPFPFPNVSGGISIDEIAEVRTSCPIELWLKNGDIIFYPLNCVHRLFEIHKHKPFRIQAKYDVWGLLLEPYLDTDLSPEDLTKNSEDLRKCGFAEAEVKRLRRWAWPVAVANMFAWEWISLSLFDLLYVFKGSLFFRFSTAYKKSIDIAHRTVETGVAPTWGFESYRETKLYKYWRELAQSANVDSRASLQAFEQVIKAYSQPHRKYHDVDHLLSVIEAVDRLRNHLKSWRSAYLAVFFHDFVYQVGKKDNEQLSVVHALEAVKAWSLSDQERNEIREHIMNTQDHLGNQRSGDFGVLSDADLFMFSRDTIAYRTQAYQIHLEYSQVPWPFFRKGRIQFLNSMRVHAEKGTVFIYFGAEANRQALRNIDDELTFLSTTSVVFRPKFSSYLGFTLKSP